MSDINWEIINDKLPFQRTEEHRAKRKNMWSSIDINANGHVSLAEITKAVRDVIAVGDLFECRTAINRAFHFAKSVNKAEDKHGSDFIEFCEFRVFLQTLRQYFEYYQAFSRIDTGNDKRISKEEFTAPAIKESIEKWVGPVENMEDEFEKIDANGGGQILFSEFVDWALAKNLDIEDDIEP